MTLLLRPTFFFNSTYSDAQGLTEGSMTPCSNHSLIGVRRLSFWSGFNSLTLDVSPPELSQFSFLTRFSTGIPVPVSIRKFTDIFFHFHYGKGPRRSGILFCVINIFPERNSGMCSGKFPEQRSGNRKFSRTRSGNRKIYGMRSRNWKIFQKLCYVHRHPHCTFSILR